MCYSIYILASATQFFRCRSMNWCAIALPVSEYWIDLQNWIGYIQKAVHTAVRVSVVPLDLAKKCMPLTRTYIFSQLKLSQMQTWKQTRPILWGGWDQLQDESSRTDCKLLELCFSSMHLHNHTILTKDWKVYVKVNGVEKPFIYARLLVLAREEQCILYEKRGHSDDNRFWNPETPDNRLHLQLVKCRCWRKTVSSMKIVTTFDLTVLEPWKWRSCLCSALEPELDFKKWCCRFNKINVGGGLVRNAATYMRFCSHRIEKLSRSRYNRALPCTVWAAKPARKAGPSLICVGSSWMKTEESPAMFPYPNGKKRAHLSMTSSC